MLVAKAAFADNEHEVALAKHFVNFVVLHERLEVVREKRDPVTPLLIDMHNRRLAIWTARPVVKTDHVVSTTRSAIPDRGFAP
ncbi:hypothetical protein ACQR07_03110 [Bradyrhizobium sp. HKCCYLS20291]